MDRILVARMTRQAGDRHTLESIGGQIAETLAPSLEAGLEQATGFTAEVSFASVEPCQHQEAAAQFGEHAVTCGAAIDDWCGNVLMIIDPVFVMALLESALGGETPASGDLAARDLSAIEMDLATEIFKQAAEALKAAILSPKPGDIAVFPTPTTGLEAVDETTPAVLMTLTLNAGSLDARLGFVLPQKTLLNSRFLRAPTGAVPPKPESPDWMGRLSEQLTNTEVTVEAAIALQEMTLGDVASLQPGDLLPFADPEASRTLLRAPDKDLFWCEFGRAGDRYTVRITEPHRTDQELMKDLMAG